MVNKRIYAKSPHPCFEPLLTHTSTEGPLQQVVLVQSPMLMCAKFCVCPPGLESLLPSVLWKFCNQIPLALKARFPGDSQSLCWIPRLGSLTWGSECSQQWENLLGLLLFSSLWVTHLAGMGFDFIIIEPLLPSCCSFFFVFGCGISFFWWAPVSSCQWLFNS